MPWPRSCSCGKYGGPGAIFGTVIPDFHYRADHPAPGTTRLLHFLFYFGALLLLVAGVHSLYLYFTLWTGGDDNSHVWQLVLGMVYLIGGLVVAYSTYHHADGEAPPPDRYVDVKGGVMTYELDQLNGKQRLPLAELTAATRPSVRDMILEFRDGRQVVLPIYLIDEEDKQAELEALLKRQATT